MGIIIKKRRVLWGRGHILLLNSNKAHASFPVGESRHLIHHFYQSQTFQATGFARPYDQVAENLKAMWTSINFISFFYNKVAQQMNQSTQVRVPEVCTGQLPREGSPAPSSPSDSADVFSVYAPVFSSPKKIH